MYKIEKKNFGYKLTFGDWISEEEMKKWVEESRTALDAAPASFGIFVDMRTLKPISAEAQQYMQQGQKLYKEKGMNKSVVILNSAMTRMQFQRIGKETGIYEWERYIDASTTADWEKIGIDWLVKNIDPDK